MNSATKNTAKTDEIMQLVKAAGGFDWPTLRAAVEALEQEAINARRATPAEKTPSQKLREAGFARRPSWRSMPKDGDDEPSVIGGGLACDPPDFPAVTDEMVAAYLFANEAYWKEVDAELKRGSVREATKRGLCAALCAAPK
jgi:hypothetical protein